MRGRDTEKEMEGTFRCSRRRLRMLSYEMREGSHAYVVEGCVVHDGEIEDVANLDVRTVVEDLGNDLGERE